jgi:pimeloyl-ACP methyl ester carboxylesterase
VTRRRAFLLVALAAIAGLALWPEAPATPSDAWIAAAGITPHHESVDGIQLRYVRGGSGAPVVLLHGFGASIYTWRLLLPELAKTHDVVALDLPGFGASDQPQDLSLLTYRRVIPALMDRLAMPSAAIVGHSLGGGVATLLAAHEPARVTRLVLIDAAGFNLAPADRPWLLRLAASQASALAARFPIRRLLVREGLRQNYYDASKVSAEEVEQYTAAAQRPGSLGAMRSLLATHGDDLVVSDEIAKVKAPTLIIWGREDAWIPVADADRFAAAIKGSRQVVLDRCGHMPQEEQPEQTLQLISQFLD